MLVYQRVHPLWIDILAPQTSSQFRLVRLHSSSITGVERCCNKDPKPFQKGYPSLISFDIRNLWLLLKYLSLDYFWFGGTMGDQGYPFNAVSIDAGVGGWWNNEMGDVGETCKNWWLRMWPYKENSPGGFREILPTCPNTWIIELPIFGGSNEQQIYGSFEGLPANSAWFRLVMEWPR